MQKEIENSKLVHFILFITGGIVITLACVFVAMIPGAPPISRAVERWVIGWPERLLPAILLDQNEGFLMLLLWNIVLYSILTGIVIRLAKKYRF
jgi:hypothetical protein